MPGGVSEKAVYQTNSLHLLTDHSGLFIGQQLLPITATRRVLTPQPVLINLCSQYQVDKAIHDYE